MEKEKKSNHVQAVDRTLAILEVLAAQGESMQLSEISQKVNLNISTVHRLLNTMIARDFVKQDEQSKYHLGLKAFQIGNAALYTLDIRSVAKPFLQDLVQKCNETANLVILDGYHVVYIDQVESKSMIKMFAKVGSRGLAHCTGAGKMLLSALKEEELDRLYAGVKLEKFTEKTITDFTLLKQALLKIREQNYSIDDQELEEGVLCLSAPIRNHEGKILAALSVSGPYSRMEAARAENNLLGLICQTAEEISQQLGYQK